MKNHLLSSISRKLSVMVCLLVVCATSFAQQQISGTVVDISGKPVIGAGIMIPGTTTGTVTDLDGKYSLSVPAGSNLEVSCIGYVNQTFTVAAGNSTYNFKLSEDSQLIEETVVIGYGTVKVKDLTGSVATVGSKDLAIPVANVGEALQGKMAGVVVTMNDGAPGAAPQIRVRGTKSITQTNDPLYIVDGFPVGDLTGVPADQIKSINVLKDAAATAIYGSRGAAGVVLVTTKNAIEGQTSVSYNGYIQIKDSSMNVRDVMQPTDYLKFTLGYARDFNAKNYTDMLDYFGMSDTMGNGTANNYANYANTSSHNYQADLYKTAISHSHNLTISNGTKKNKTIFSINYLNDDGTVINSYYKRLNASLKTIEKLTDNFNVELSASYDYGNYRRDSRLASAFMYRAIDNPMGDASNLSGFGNGSSYIDDAYNPVDLTNNYQNDYFSHSFRGIGAINWTPIDGLTLRSEIGLNKRFYKNEEFSAGFGTTTNSASLERGDKASMHWTTTAQYQLPLSNEDHKADIMVGNEYISSSGENMQFYAYEYPSNFDRETAFAMMNQFTNDYTFTTDVDDPSKSISFFTRANYSYLDRYLVTLTLRADGSSKFAPNNRWGYFPAAAFAWRAIDEPFMSNTKDWLSNLKVRLSYGITGSDAINANLWKETWSLSSSPSNYTISSQRTDTEGDFGYAYAPGSMMMNPDLKWESTTTRNIGVDYGFFNDRLYGSVEGYWSTTNDLLMPVNVNQASGYTYQYQNMGTVSNKGIELSIGGDIVRTGDFTLSANFIYNYNHNNIDKLSDAVAVNTYGQWTNSEHCPLTGEYLLQEGKAIGTIRGYKYLGWYTTDDFNYDAATKTYTLKEGIPDYAQDSYFTSFNLPDGQSAFPGALKFEDIDKNGSLTTEDTYEIGEMTPRSTGSFNINARWKNLDVSANFNYAIGGHIMNYYSLMATYGAKDNNFGANRLSFVSEAYSPYRWTSEGQLEYVTDPDQLDEMNANATMHTPTSMEGFLLDNYIESASYLRLKNLTIGYTFPKNISKKVGINNLRAYVSATNLLTFTGYSGLDPEVNTNRTRGNYGGGSFPTPGVDNNAYPIAKTFTFGLNITL